MRMLAIQLSESLRHKLKILAEKRMTTEEAIAVQALQSYIAILEEETLITAHDLAKDFIGISHDGPEDLSTNPQYMEGYGSPRGGK